MIVYKQRGFIMDCQAYNMLRIWCFCWCCDFAWQPWWLMEGQRWGKVGCCYSKKCFRLGWPWPTICSWCWSVCSCCQDNAKAIEVDVAKTNDAFTIEVDEKFIVCIFQLHWWDKHVFPSDFGGKAWIISSSAILQKFSWHLMKKLWLHAQLCRWILWWGPCWHS